MSSPLIVERFRFAFETVAKSQRLLRPAGAVALCW